MGFLSKISKEVEAVYYSRSLKYKGAVYPIHETSYKHGGQKVHYITLDGKLILVDYPHGVKSVDRDVSDFGNRQTTIFEFKNPNERLVTLQRSDLEDGGRGY